MRAPRFQRHDRRAAAGPPSGPPLPPALRPALLLLTAAFALLAGCQDLRDFAGTWHGSVVADPALAHGFAPGAALTVQVTAADRETIALHLTLPGDRPARFMPIKRAAGDALADVQMPGEPLRTFFGFVHEVDPALPPYLAVVSLFSDSRMELRLIRGADDAYGVFALRRVPDRPTGPTP